MPKLGKTRSQARLSIREETGPRTRFLNFSHLRRARSADGIDCQWLFHGTAWGGALIFRLKYSHVSRVQPEYATTARLVQGGFARL